jgi:hypothetical protein
MTEITSRLSTALAWPEKRGGEDPQNHAMRLLALATIVIAGSTPASAQDVVLRGGNVVDVQTGEVTVAPYSFVTALFKPCRRGWRHQRPRPFYSPRKLPNSNAAIVLGV